MSGYQRDRVWWSPSASIAANSTPAKPNQLINAWAFGAPLSGRPTFVGSATLPARGVPNRIKEVLQPFGMFL
jgi:hypothetical protein